MYQPGTVSTLDQATPDTLKVMMGVAPNKIVTNEQKDSLIEELIINEMNPVHAKQQTWAFHREFLIKHPLDGDYKYHIDALFKIMYYWVAYD